jgi:hypothetical protein
MKKLIFLFIAAGLMIAGCTKSDYNSPTMPGKLVLKITDDPFNINYVESATVKITKVEIRKAGDGIPDGNPFIVVSEDTLTLNLLDLRNGVTSSLPEIEIPQGKYDLIRLYVDEAGLKLKDHPEEFNVKVPSGKQTGIKIFIRPALQVEGGLTSELLLDFDLSRSFVMRGNLAHSAGVNGFIFKPCIRATNISTSGRIVGMVTDTSNIKIKEATVWVKQDTTVATSIADTLGHYAIIGLPAGTYSVFATKESYDTVSYSDIKVYAGNVTVRNFELTKLPTP